MLISRSDRGALARWWFTIDKLLLSALLLLMAAGVIINLAASPPVADRLGLDPFHFIERQLAFLLPAAIVLILASFLDERRARWLALAVLCGGLALMALAILAGPEVKGAHRWWSIGPLTVQPSEFVKPAFIVIAAWLLSEQAKRPEMPGLLLASLLFATIIAGLAAQPDFGQAALLSAVFALMLLTYGIPWVTALGLFALGLVGVFLAYRLLPHVASRIDRFFSPDKGDTFQIDTATKAFNNGGLFGTGPGGGEAKQTLPDAHSDFIFSVLGEEFGFVAGAAMLGLFLFIIMRVLFRALDERDGFNALALTGLISMFGLQAVINIAVNLSLLPAKGMTLPFISYGGSSLLSTAYGMGMVLVFGRWRPRTEVKLKAQGT
jgi:cell division protein FtsW